MKARFSTLLLTIVAVLMVIPPVAAQESAEQTLFTSTLGSTRFNYEVSVSVSQPYSSALRLDLNVDFDSTISGSSGDGNQAATVLGGVVAVAIPEGIEMVGDARLYFKNRVTGEYDFMYSSEFPANRLTTGLEQAMADATGSNPWQIMSGLERMQQQLAPQSQFIGPADERLTGNSPGYAVAGKTWLMPVNISFNEISNVFSPADSIDPQPGIRIKFPITLTGDALPKGIVVYTGGISSGVVKGQVMPGSLPELFIPLAPLPEPPEPAPDPVEGEDASEVEVTEAVTPEPVPALLYANQWIAWETEVDLPDVSVNHLLEEFSDRFELAGDVQSAVGEGTIGLDPGGAVVNPASPSEEVVDQSDTELPSEEKDVFIGIDSGEATPTVEPQAASEVAEPASAEAELPLDDKSASVEVALGTLPDQDIEYHIELKPITGSAGSAAVAAQPDNSQPGATSGGGPSYLDEMALVEEGYFLIGTSNTESAGDQDELPQTSVFLPAYYIDKYPVTNRKFYQFVIDTGYKPQGKWDKYFNKGAADLPVRGVTWNDASSYAEYVGKRLPTEAEWEKAARGVDGRLYPWGNDWSSEILPRGEMLYDILHAPKSVSPYGVMGMVGVLWQWTSSQYAPYPYDPAARSDEYVLRGGCFSNGRNIVRCANRYSQPPNVALNTFSFRCARDAGDAGSQ